MNRIFNKSVQPIVNNINIVPKAQYINKVQDKCLTTDCASRNINNSADIMEKKYNSITSSFVKTTAYSLDNRDRIQNPSLFAGNNSLQKRIKRWLKEDYVVMPTLTKSSFEIINSIFTISLFIFTILLLILAYKYSLELVPKSIINRDLLTETQKKELEWYNNVQFTSDIVKGVSIFCLVLFSTIRVFKRTTV